MLHPDSIKQVKEVTSIYPGKNNGKIGECSTVRDNKFATYDAMVRNSEVDLVMYLKTGIGSKLNEKERETLLKLIEEYGEQRYEDGQFDATYEG